MCYGRPERLPIFTMTITIQCSIITVSTRNAIAIPANCCQLLKVPQLLSITAVLVSCCVCVCVSQLEGVVSSTDELERSVHFLDKDVLLFNIVF